jgi:glycosyltransferase involved in cell wall biosynthesis
LWEGFGIVLIEALALNIPIISTDCSVGPREVLCPELNIERSIEYPHYGKYGILNKTFRNIDCNNMDKIIAKSLSNEEIMFAKLMIEILENDDLRKKYSFGIERANDFDIEKISERWIDVIKSL